MNSSRTVGFTHSIQGQILRRSERREAAIFLRDRSLWVADFVDGHGELIDAATWFRFNCGGLWTSHARRRMVLESAIPLSADIVDRIERLDPPAPDPKRPGNVSCEEVVVDVNRSSQPRGRRSVAPLITAIAIALGVATVGYVAVTAAEHSSPHGKAPINAASNGPESTTERTERAGATRSPAGSIEGPRECRPDAGIDSECIFN